METGRMTDSMHRMTNEIADTLEGGLRCIWLYGSVGFGDLRMGWSDIDFVALTDGPITENQATKLLTLRQTLSEGEPENLYYRAFEGIIADIHEYRRNSYSKLVYWGTSGQRITDIYVNDAFSQLELSKYGRSVYGTAERAIFLKPCREDIVKAVQAHYKAIRKYACHTDARLYSCGWLLDIARCIYTLRNNDVTAKTKAGIWALENHIFQNEAPLKRTLEIRLHPLEFRDREDVKHWLNGLGPTVVQQYADVLEAQLLLCL